MSQAPASASMLPGEAPQGPEEAPAQPDWAALPQELLAAILRHPTSRAHQGVRLVCKRLRDAFDGGVRHGTLRLQPLLLSGDRGLPPAPACVRAVALDGSGLSQWGVLQDWLHDWEPAELFDALAAWPVAAPLELDFSHNRDMFKREGRVQKFADMLRSPSFAPGGLQALNLRACKLCGVGIAAFAAALPAAPQLSALRELNLKHTNLGPDGIVALCGALAAATQIRSLTQLDLSGNASGADYNAEGSGGTHPLVACLRSGPHLSSLQHLELSDTSIGKGGAAALATAVADAGLQLKTLSLHANSIGDQGAAAWAAVLLASTCLAGLEELHLGRNGVTDAGMAQVIAALQAATYMTSLRKLQLLPNPFNPASILQLLAAAPHLAASLERINLRCWDLSTRAAMDAFAAPLLGGLQLPRLTNLDLSFCGCGLSRESVQGLCALLHGATQLSGLQELNLSYNYLCGEDTISALFSAFSASHLSSLRRLDLDEVRGDACMHVDWVRLLRSATHLRGLTCFQYHSYKPFSDESRFEAVCTLLELMPHIRQLDLWTILKDEAQLGRLLGALQRAPCLPELQELELSLSLALEDKPDAHDFSATMPGIASFLRSCTRLTGLRCLDLSLNYAGEPGYEAVGEALAAARHLCSLRELRLSVGSGSPMEAWQGLWRHLAAPHLQGVAVHIK